MESPSVALRITGAVAGFHFGSLRYTSELGECQAIFALKLKNVLLWSCAGYLAGVVAVASLDGEALALDAHLYVMNIRGPVRAPGRIGEGVLVARFLANPRVELFQRLALGREIDLAPGVVRVVDQSRELALQERARHRHTVDLDVVVQQGFHHAVVRHLVGLLAPIGSVGNQENELAAIAVAVMEKLRRPNHPVIQRFGRLPTDGHRRGSDVGLVSYGRVSVDGWRIGDGPARRSHGRLRIQLRALQFRKQQIVIGRKSIPGMEKLVKTADKGFVFQA